MENILKHYNMAREIAVQKVQTEARKELKSDLLLDEFIMGMGTYFFTNKDGDNLSEYKCEGVDSVIMEWDSILKIKGEPMRFHPQKVK